MACCQLLQTIILQLIFTHKKKERWVKIIESPIKLIHCLLDWILFALFTYQRLKKECRCCTPLYTIIHFRLGRRKRERNSQKDVLWFLWLWSPQGFIKRPASSSNTPVSASLCFKKSLTLLDSAVSRDTPLTADWLHNRGSVHILGILNLIGQ